ncbi:unnamed protein product [Caenorhabditis brenneri]
MSKLFIQNFDYLSLGVSIPITLNDLLMMNSSFIDIYAPKISNRDLNIFMRYWMNNTTSKLECLDLDYGVPIDRELEEFIRLDEKIIFNGIPYIEQPKDLKRDFTLSVDFDPIYQNGLLLIEGGFDVTRRDGTTATITIDYNHPYFRMLIWP